MPEIVIVSLVMVKGLDIVCVPLDNWIQFPRCGCIALTSVCKLSIPA